MAASIQDLMGIDSNSGEIKREEKLPEVKGNNIVD